MARADNFQQVQHEQNRAQLAAVSERVDGMQQDIKALEVDIQNIGNRFDTSLGNVRKDMNASMALITDKLDRRDDRRWMWPVVVSACSLVLAVTGIIGAMALGPIRDRQAEQLLDMRALRLEAKEQSREAKAEAKEAAKDLYERDRRMWDFMLRHRQDFDAVRGLIGQARPSAGS